MQPRETQPLTGADDISSLTKRQQDFGRCKPKFKCHQNPGTAFAYLQTGQETVNLNPASLQTQEREAVEVTLPNSMHTGQIFLLTKLLTATDLRFYEFKAVAPVERWRSN